MNSQGVTNFTYKGDSNKSKLYQKEIMSRLNLMNACYHSVHNFYLAIYYTV
jgi:hypothetical protein